MSKPRVYSFSERYAFSAGVRQSTDVATIKAMIPGCISVVKTGKDKDRSGVDYLAQLRDGRTIGIDAKSRDAGCSRFWRHGPEFTLEILSNEEERRPGWTWDPAKQTEMVLFTFARQDSTKVYLVSFQSLRMAFLMYGREWAHRYGKKRAATHRPYGPPYHTTCLFVPAEEVLRAIARASEGTIQLPNEAEEGVSA